MTALCFMEVVVKIVKPPVSMRVQIGKFLHHACTTVLRPVCAHILIVRNNRELVFRRKKEILFNPFGS